MVDAQGTLRYMSPVHEKFFKLSRGEGVGRPAREVIENTRLDTVLREDRFAYADFSLAASRDGLAD